MSAILTLKTPAELSLYSAWIHGHPQGSLWQSLEWKGYQEALGRETKIYALMEKEQIVASALVIIDQTIGGLSTWDIPRGPLAVESGKVKVGSLLDQILEDAKGDKCLSLYASSTFNVPLSTFHSSSRHEQPEATRILDLRLSDEELLGQMKPKGRYNIHVAEKHGVLVKESKDIDAWYALAQSTGERDQFGILPKRHYETFLRNLPGSFLLIAEHDKKPVAGLMGVIWNQTGIYYYGASSYEHRALMAPYLLQWEAIRLSKVKNCASYDLLGIAPVDAADHPWASISSFKEKFGGFVVTYPAEQQIVLKPFFNRLLGWKRKILG